ncbi:gluconokinase [Cryobacterium aureum]|uniref:gluconokinase n=1 Tax=Cryobacterium aureum TaxID=995037 RepID=UPI000CF3ACBD|nr:gluconokinase [Cryobacterium aureum]
MTDPRSAPPLIVVIGASGSGKSTIGAAIADRLAIPFIDADSLHPSRNIKKMQSGNPLTDDDRWSWLARVGVALAGAQATGMVVACSALKRSYRDAILAEAPLVLIVHLNGSKETLVSRLAGRSGHFMPSALLDSQLAALEPLGAGEPGVVVNIEASVENVIAEVLNWIRQVTSRPDRGLAAPARLID